LGDIAAHIPQYRHSVSAMRAVYEGELLQCNAPIRAADHRFQDRMPTIRAISVRLAGIFNAPGLLPSLPSR
jgi:hypothetical protein